MRHHRILNADGKPIVLAPREQRLANHLQRQVNDLGYEVNITTLTAISKKIVQQKFFEIPPADYVPIRVGENTWATSITTFRSFAVADEFETGVVNLAGQNGRLASADVALDAVNVKVYNWAKEIGYTIMELQQAQKYNNWDLVSEKERARKENWDLGIQRIAFLGARGLTGSAPGLLNQAGITTNATVITKPISTMTPAELKVFTGSIMESYRANCLRTAWPTHFIIPESDYNGLAATVSPDFPMKSILQILEEAFQTITRNKNFQILPLAYADARYSGLAYNLYVLYKYDENSIRMDIPLDYTNTLANTVNSFQFQSVGYGQFSGVQVYRPLEMLYYTAPAT